MTKMTEKKLDLKKATVTNLEMNNTNGGVITDPTFGVEKTCAVSCLVSLCYNSQCCPTHNIEYGCYATYRC